MTNPRLIDEWHRRCGRAFRIVEAVTKCRISSVQEAPIRLAVALQVIASSGASSGHELSDFAQAVHDLIESGAFEALL
jgi:hypothetical protein